MQQQTKQSNRLLRYFLCLGCLLFLAGPGCKNDKSAAQTQPPAPETPAGEELYAGHSAPDHPSEITSRQAHHDTLAKLLDEFYTKEQLGPAKQRIGHYGIDVSRWQSNIEWAEVAADSLPHPISFVFIKATQGHNLVDARFKNNWDEAQKHKFRIGAYHFYRYKDDPVQQANNYIKTVPLSKGHLMPIVDVEFDCATCTSPGIPTEKMIGDLKKYVAAIEQHYGVKPIIYTFEGFYHQYLKNQFPDHLYWMALYNSHPPKELPIKEEHPGDPRIVLWQFTDSGKLPGITSTVDMSFLPAQFEKRVIIQ